MTLCEIVPACKEMKAMDYHYLKDSCFYRFQPSAGEYSYTNAWWLAEASCLAYTHHGFARMAFELAGLHQFRSFLGRQACGMVAWNHNFCIISFRGTESDGSDAETKPCEDYDLLPLPFDGTGKVFQKYLQAFEEIWTGEDGMDALICKIKSRNDRIRFWVTGHSFGGALASLCFARFSDAIGLYVFGAPPAGDDDFSENFLNRQAYRFEPTHDLFSSVADHQEDWILAFSSEKARWWNRIRIESHQSPQYPFSERMLPHNEPPPHLFCRMLREALITSFPRM